MQLHFFHLQLIALLEMCTAKDPYGSMVVSPTLGVSSGGSLSSTAEGHGIHGVSVQSRLEAEAGLRPLRHRDPGIWGVSGGRLGDDVQ